MPRPRQWTFLAVGTALILTATSCGDAEPDPVSPEATGVPAAVGEAEADPAPEYVQAPVRCGNTTCNPCQDCRNRRCQDKPGAPGGYRTDYQLSPRRNGSWDWNCDGTVQISVRSHTLDCNSGASPPRFCTPETERLTSADCGQDATTFQCRYSGAPGTADPDLCDSTNHRRFRVGCR